jgi:hypothetical protein
MMVVVMMDILMFTMGDKKKGIRLLENIPSDFGGGYLLMWCNGKRSVGE